MRGVPRFRRPHAIIRRLLSFGLFGDDYQPFFPLGDEDEQSESFTYVCTNCSHRKQWSINEPALQCDKCNGIMLPEDQ